MKEKIERPEINVDIVENFKLVRERDKLCKIGAIKWIEWDHDGNFKNFHDKPQVGFACIVNPQHGYFSYTWLTTTITELISDTEFKTENSHYRIEPVDESEIL